MDISIEVTVVPDHPDPTTSTSQRFPLSRQNVEDILDGRLAPFAATVQQMIRDTLADAVVAQERRRRG